MESSVRVKTFSQEFEGQQVFFYVLCLKQSFLLWAGTDLSFTSLSVAMNTRFVSQSLLSVYICVNLNAPPSLVDVFIHAYRKVTPQARNFLEMQQILPQVVLLRN